MGLLGILQRYDTVERITRFICHKDIVPSWEEWCVGLAEAPERALRFDPKASFANSFAVPVGSVAVARGVQKHLIKRYGMDRGLIDGENPRYVYVFKKTADIHVQDEAS